MIDVRRLHEIIVNYTSKLLRALNFQLVVEREREVKTVNQIVRWTVLIMSEKFQHVRASNACRKHFQTLYVYLGTLYSQYYLLFNQFFVSCSYFLISFFGYLEYCASEHIYLTSLGRSLIGDYYLYLLCMPIERLCKYFSWYEPSWKSRALSLLFSNPLIVRACGGFQYLIFTTVKVVGTITAYVVYTVWP